MVLEIFSNLNDPMKFYENKFYSRHNTSLSASDPGTKFNFQNYNSEHEKQFIITTE